MSSESEEQCSLAQSKSAEDTSEIHKEPKFSYTRNFLFSLSELRMCKTLPSGFDRSILWEPGDSLTELFQSPRYSDSSSLCGNLSQKSLQIPKHGLLGSGPFTSRSENISEASTPLAQGSSSSLLNKSKAPYRPPHLCKADTHYGRVSKDFYNDETHGSSQHGSQKKTEEVSNKDELMRKDQQKDFQKNQSKLGAAYKENLDPYIITTLEAEKEKRLENRYNAPEECIALSSPFSDYSGNCLTTQTSATGSLVPSVPKSKPVGNDFELNTSMHSSIPEQACEVNGNSQESSLSHSSVCVHEFHGEEKMVGSIQSGDRKGDSKVHITDRKSKYLSSGRNELASELVKSTSTSATDDISVPIESNSDGKDRVLPCADDHGHDASDDLLSFIQKWLEQTDVKVNEAGPLKRTHESIMYSSSVKQSELEKIEEGLSVSDSTHPSVRFDLQSQPDSVLSVASSKENISLPEEDSLITVDDWILPQDPTSLAARHSVESVLYTSSSSQFNIGHRLPAPNLTPFGHRVHQIGSEGHIIDAYDMMDMEPSYDNLTSQHSCPQFRQHHINPRGASFKSSYAQKGRLRSKIGSLDLNTYHFNQQLPTSLPITAPVDPFQLPYAELTRFGHSISSPQLHQTPLPRTFSSRHIHGLPRHLPSSHSVNERTSYTQHPPQNAPLFIQQQYYRGAKMPTTDHGWWNR